MPVWPELVDWVINYHKMCHSRSRFAVVEHIKFYMVVYDLLTPEEMIGRVEFL